MDLTGFLCPLGMMLTHSRLARGAVGAFMSLNLEACFLVGDLCIQLAWMSTALAMGPQGELLFSFALILQMFVTSNTLFCTREESIRFRLNFVWDSLSPSDVPIFPDRCFEF